MIARHYNVGEIDELRRACEMRWIYGTTNLALAPAGGSYDPAEKAPAVEAMVRTHMMAGHTAQDLYRQDHNET